MRKHEFEGGLISMGYVEWNCPKCGKKNREACNAWVYGSPIRNCKACNQEYFDDRWREIALEVILLSWQDAFLPEL